MNEETTGKIAAKLADIMADARAIGKDSVNRQQGFSFRGIDAVMNHLHPVFAKHRVTLSTDVLSDLSEHRQSKSGGDLIYRILKLRVTYTADDGSSLGTVVMAEGMDSGDKASNKAMAIGLKIALTQTLLLPYDEVDPDADTPPPSRKTAPAATSATPPPAATPATPAPTAPAAPAKPAAPPATPPAPTAPPQEPRPGTHVAVTTLLKAGNKQTQSKRGPSTLTWAKDQTGNFFSTFDEAIGADLLRAADNGTEVEIEYKEVTTPKGITRSVLAMRTPGSEPAAKPEDKCDDLPF